MLIGGIPALIQLRSTVKLRRAKFINKIINITRFDKELTKAMYTIEETDNWYDENFHNGNNIDVSYNICRLLSYFDYICYLYISKNISYKEFRTLKYRVTVIFKSLSAKTYLWNIYHYSMKKMNVECSFINLIDYGIKNNILTKEFKENSTDLYKNIYSKWQNEIIDTDHVSVPDTKFPGVVKKLLTLHRPQVRKSTK